MEQTTHQTGELGNAQGWCGYTGPWTYHGGSECVINHGLVGRYVEQVYQLHGVLLGVLSLAVRSQGRHGLALRLKKLVCWFLALCLATISAGRRGRPGISALIG